MTDQPTTPPIAGDIWRRPYLDVLKELNRGAVAGDCTDRLHELVQGIKDTGKKGSVTVTLTIEPSGKNNTEILLVAAAITSKVPRPAAKQSSFYVTDDGNLSSRDPRQLAFESLKVVEAATELKEQRSS